MRDHEHLAVIGDVHGDAETLERAVDDLADDGRVLVFVGDYINRGPDSRRVLDLLVQTRKHMQRRLVLLLGNHDHALLTYLSSGDPANFLRHGGLATMRSYLGSIPPPDPFSAFRDHFPGDHHSLLLEARTHFETDSVLISHCGVNPTRPHSRDVEDMVLGRFPDLFRHPVAHGKELVVCGHYVQRPAAPFITQTFICLDTGCGSHAGAPLTALLLPERVTRTYGGPLD